MRVMEFVVDLYFKLFILINFLNLTKNKNKFKFILKRIKKFNR